VGRAALFSDEQILATATQQVARAGPRASVAALARSLGAPSGSIYYRFASRDTLVAEVWLRAVRDFQHGFLAALDRPDLDDAALAAATHVPRWCAASLDQAIVLHRHRLEDLVDAWPESLAPDRAALNKDLHSALRRHASGRYGSARGVAFSRTTLALVNVPGGAVRPFLDRHQPPPEWAIDAIGAASLAVLRAGPVGSGRAR
jgi:AcrR family transcriptional regulator